MEKFKVGGKITLIFMLFQTVFLHISNPSGLEPIYFRKIPFYREIPHKVQTIVSGPLKAFYLVSFHFFVQLYWNYPVEKLPVVNRGLLLQKHSFRICIQIQVPILDLSSTPVDFQTRLITLQELTDELVIWRNKKDIELFVAIHMLLLKFGCQ